MKFLKINEVFLIGILSLSLMIVIVSSNEYAAAINNPSYITVSNDIKIDTLSMNEEKTQQSSGSVQTNEESSGKPKITNPNKTSTEGSSSTDTARLKMPDLGSTVRKSNSGNQGIGQSQSSGAGVFDNQAGIKKLCIATSNPCHGTAGDDTMRGDDGPNLMYGKKGDDLMSGNGAGDEMRGDEGNDRISAGAGNDRLFGNAGNDRMDGGPGDDFMLGDDYDILTSGDDIMYGGDGNDNIFGGGGLDYIYGQGGNDKMYGDWGNNVMDGGLGNDMIVGGEDNDNITGGDGNDILLGYLGADRIVGGDGDDRIFHSRESYSEAPQGGDPVGLTNPDGSKDTIDCGPGNDEVWINVATDKDTAVNCEQIHRDPPKPRGGLPTPDSNGYNPSPSYPGYYALVKKWGSMGSNDGKFRYPMGVDVDSSGNVYVADRDNYRIQKFTSDGTFITKWDSKGTGEGQLEGPKDIAIHSGNAYVIDVGGDEGERPRIQKFTSDGTFITQWGSFGSGDGQFQDPSGITVDSSGNVYVTDMNNVRVQKFTSNGTFLTKWNYSLDQPDGIALDSAGNVYVADSKFVSKFTSNGTFITQWGSRGSADGEFESPSGIDLDSSDNVYVADTLNHRVQKFTSNGTFITKWVPETTGPLPLPYPHGIALDSSGSVYVSNLGNHNIQKFVWKNYVANPDKPGVVTK